MGEYAKVPKRAFEFMEHPKIQPWLTTVQRNRTRQTYAYELLRLLEAIKKTPEQLLSDLEGNPKQASIEIKTHLGGMPSKVVASVRQAAVRSFAAFYECDLRMNGLKIRPARTRKKPYLAWNDAERIIAECKEPYRSTFRFMLWGGIGVDEFAEIQGSAAIQADIEKQRTNDKPYVRIDLRPRKSTIDVYFILVPKQYVPHFPVLTTEYHDKDGQLSRGRQPVGSNDLETYWQRASERAGLRQIGMGPHTLRSAFRSQCAKAGVVREVSEFQMGHGPGDKYGYSREVQDETYVAGELSKLWKGAVAVTEDQLATRDQEIATLRAEVERLQRIEEARKPLDDRMSRLLEDREVQAVLKRRIKATSKKMESS